MPAPNPLPPEVAAALQKGNLLEAVKLLRKFASVSLREARDAIDRQARGDTPPAPSREPRQDQLPLEAPPVQIPIEALQALRQGREIEAIRIVREKARVGLKEAKDAVDRYRRQHPEQRLGLSPGEVPPAGNEFWILAALLIAAFGLWLFFF